MQTKIVDGQIQGTLTKTERNKLTAAAEVLDAVALLVPDECTVAAKALRTIAAGEHIVQMRNGKPDVLDQSPEASDD